jgi:S-adenosylmethionine-diacylglycerol 3-amino-3-carboxypropyl transferase
MGNFYSRLSYSFGNEDWITEQKALRIKPKDRVVSITASGDRPLNLLATELGELVSVDTNPMQNALFDLKRAAIKKLDYAEYISFLGVGPHPDRSKAYSLIEKDLSPISAKLWSRHRTKISRGVLYEGAVEKWLRVASRILRPFRGKKIDKLFSFDDINEQQAFLNTHWHTYFWKKTFHIVLHPWITRFFIKDPGLYAYVDQEIHIGNHLYDKLHGSLNRFLAKESVLLSLILKGDVDKNHFPPYLNQAGFAQIKSQIDKARFETIDMASFLENSPENSIDCFSCSDIASYISKQNFERVVKGMLRAAKPGARFCMRQFLSNYQIPADIASCFVRDASLEEELEKEDRCFVYRFMCGTIQK